MGFIYPVGFLEGGDVGNSHSLDLELSSSQYAYINDGDSTNLDFTGNGSVECWVKFESLTIDPLDAIVLVGKYGAGAGSAGWQFYVIETDPGYALALIVTAGGSAEIESVVWAPSLATWYHVAVSWEDVGTSTDVKFYVDGSQQGSTQNSGLDPMSASSYPLAIGCEPDDLGDQLLDGRIDDVRVWNDVRTQTEFNDNKDVELEGNEAGLVAYWKFNAGYLDETSNDNDLTGVGSTFSTDVPF